MGAALQVQGITGIAPVLTALGLSRATFYRRRRAEAQARAGRPRPPRALGENERTQVLEALHSPRGDVLEFL
jgi:hypothetical protein